MSNRWNMHNIRDLTSSRNKVEVEQNINYRVPECDVMNILFLEYFNFGLKF